MKKNTGKKIHRSIKDVINSIRVSYLFSKTLKHGIKRTNDCMNFEPTKFVYSYFTFNTIYDIDWSESFKRMKIWEKRDTDYTSEKIFHLVSYLHEEYLSSSFIENYRLLDSELNIIINSEKINVDSNIGRADECNFIDAKKTYVENYRDALQELMNDTISVESHYKLLSFCNQVRNNMFHGAKDANDLVSGPQKDRFEGYSFILQATIAMFFDMVENNYPGEFDEEKKLLKVFGLLNNKTENHSQNIN